MLQVLLGALTFVGVLIHLVFFLAVKFKRNDFADVIWGPGMLLASLGGLTLSWWLNPQFQFTKLDGLALILLTLWSLRLFFHLGIRTLSHDQEDIRYQKMRENWKDSWKIQSYLKVFVLQGFLMIVNVCPVLWILGSQDKSLTGFSLLATALWLVGFVIESLSDYQLKEFKKNPINRGQLIRSGLWGWSRHPNYFGEILQWWALFLLALPLSGGIYTIIGPLMITFFLVKVSGIPLLERNMQSRSGFEDYKNTTSLLIPWPPRKELTKDL
jgi:steroid 5-alpha reductase family enzyme